MNAPTLKLIPQPEVPLVKIVVEERDGFVVTADVPCPLCLDPNYLPRHKAKPNCESGGYDHCTCDICF